MSESPTTAQEIAEAIEQMIISASCRATTMVPDNVPVHLQRMRDAKTRLTELLGTIDEWR